MPSHNCVTLMLSIAMILFATSLVLYASWVFSTKAGLLGQTIIAEGGKATTGGVKITDAVTTTSRPVTLTPCFDTTFTRVDTSSLTCYKVFEASAATVDAGCVGSKMATVDTPAENARVQAYIDSLGFRGFFYIGVIRPNANDPWVNSNLDYLDFAETFFDAAQHEGAGPYAYMKTRGNGYWYQTDGPKYINDGFYFICQMDN